MACHGLYTFGWPNDSYLELVDHEQLNLSEVLIDQPFTDARLVVLSACQTAVVGADLTPDEVIGLATSSLRAGSAGIIGTLWQVDDLASALLMRFFYSYHIIGDPETEEGPMHPARALRLAQRALAKLSLEEVDEYVDKFNEFIASRHEETTAPIQSSHLRAPARDFRSTLESEYPFVHPRHWAAFIFIGA